MIEIFQIFAIVFTVIVSVLQLLILTTIAGSLIKMKKSMEYSNVIAKTLVETMRENWQDYKDQFDEGLPNTIGTN